MQVWILGAGGQKLPLLSIEGPLDLGGYYPLANASCLAVYGPTMEAQAAFG